MFTFAGMENPALNDTPIPPDCFRLEEVELFHSLGGETLHGVHYYAWLEVGTPAAAGGVRFLLALELLFESGASLLLSSSEDSEAIQVITAAKLSEMAARLQQLHGEPTIQRINRSAQGIWQAVMGKKLLDIQLSRHQNGLYRNDALMLEFSASGIIVELLEEAEGLQVRAY